MGQFNVFTFWRGLKNKVTAKLGWRALFRWERAIPVTKLPDNVYGFTLSSPLVEEVRKNHPGDLKLKPKRKPYWCFEVQKTNGQLIVLGYVDQLSFDQLHTAAPDQPLVLRLFPVPWEHLPRLVGIPLIHIKAIKEECVTSDHEEIEFLDLKTSAAIVNVQAH